MHPHLSGVPTPKGGGAEAPGRIRLWAQCALPNASCTCSHPRHLPPRPGHWAKLVLHPFRPRFQRALTNSALKSPALRVPRFPRSFPPQRPWCRSAVPTPRNPSASSRKSSCGRPQSATASAGDPQGPVRPGGVKPVAGTRQQQHGRGQQEVPCTSPGSESRSRFAEGSHAWPRVKSCGPRRSLRIPGKTGQGPENSCVVIACLALPGRHSAPGRPVS